MGIYTCTNAHGSASHGINVACRVGIPGPSFTKDIISQDGMHHVDH